MPASSRLHRLLMLGLLSVSPQTIAWAQLGSPSEPLRFVEGTQIDPDRHEAGLPYLIGVESLQVMRANRSHPAVGQAPGWTYNHAPDMIWWKGHFYLEYLSNPVDEHVAPGETLQLHSADGRHWSNPVLLFPPYEAPLGVSLPPGSTGYMMHQRLGYYAAPNGRLLALAFYGHAENPFQTKGIGRVVREVHEDGSLGPIYFIRYETHAAWNESNTSFPFYERSKDLGFVEACRALLADRLKTLQWRDEDDEGDPRYQFAPGETKLEAFNSFHRADGKLVMLWKKSMVALSGDEALSFKPVKVPSLVMSGGKVWGQRSADGRYALVYNPIELSQYRFPLVAISSPDGIAFHEMALLQAEVPVRRYSGRWKDFGPNYTRGLPEGNQVPGDHNLWVTYSMNKEDIWVSRVPVPLRTRVQGPVYDNFDDQPTGGPLPDWNRYNTLWAHSTVVESGDGHHRVLRLEDEDPCDRTRAIRVFQESSDLRLRLQLRALTKGPGRLWIEIASRDGHRPVRLSFDANGTWRLEVPGGQERAFAFTPQGRWVELRIALHLRPKSEKTTERKQTDSTESVVSELSEGSSYDLELGDEVKLRDLRCVESVGSVERLSLATGPYTDLPNRSTPNENADPVPEGADEKAPPLLFDVDQVRIE